MQNIDKLSDELKALEKDFEDLNSMAQDIAGTLNNELQAAFRDVIFGTKSMNEALKSLAMSMANDAFKQAMTPLINGVSGLISGAVAGAMPFAKGGVVSSPTFFGMNSGLGVMGEAGAEAIMPLKRGPDGKLGVASEGQSQAMNVTFNITTKDAESFNKSRRQIAKSFQSVLKKV